MRIWSSALRRCVGIAGISFAALSTPAQTLQLGSALNPSVESPADGGGDSFGPALSPDGRYVVFSSTTRNLVGGTNQSALPWTNPARQQVFLRDRVAGTTTLVSVNQTSGSGANGDSFPAGVSTNGRYVLFESVATDLAADDTNQFRDVFVRDLASGSTRLVSANTNGLAGNGNSRNAAMTPDGRYVTFVSSASDLVPSDTNRIADVFVRDLQSGGTVLVSAGATSLSKTLSQGSSENPALSDDGRYVAFVSTATNLVDRVPGGGDIYIRDLENQSNIWASAEARALAQTALKTTNVACYNLALSADGTTLAFEVSSNSTAGSTSGLIFQYDVAGGTTTLVYTNAAVQSGLYLDSHTLDITPDGRRLAFIANAGSTSGTTTCVYVWDAEAGTNLLASGDLTGEIGTNTTCEWPGLDATGRFVVFLSNAPGLVTNAVSSDYHLFVRDLLNGTTTLVDADTNSAGAGVSAATVPQLSADGAYVAFESADSSLVPHDQNRALDVFLRALGEGRTELASARLPALPSLSGNGAISGTQPSLSRDGHFVVFSSDANNLVDGDANGYRDVFVRDQLVGTTTLASVDTNGWSANSGSTEAVVSADGRYVAFTSLADNLVLGDTNRAQDVFVRDLRNSSTLLVSVNTSGLGSGNRASYSPQITPDGRFVLFRSTAGNLASGTFTGENLFVRDVVASNTFPLTRTGVYFFTPPNDASLVSYVDMMGLGSGKLYVRDLNAAVAMYTNGSLGLSSGAASPSGERVVYWAGSGVSSLFANDLIVNTNWAIVSGLLPGPHSALGFDGAGQTLVYTAVLDGTNQVYVYNFQTGSNTLVSTTFDSHGPGNGDSSSADISADGRFIVFRSAATDLLPGDTNGVPDIFLYDIATGGTTLLSTGPTGGFANNRSLLPAFSADGHTVCFESWASDLSDQDENQASDLFIYSLFYAELSLAAAPVEGTWVSWPAGAGRNYRVEFKDRFSASGWQELPGTITRSGAKAFLLDPKPASSKFYRIRAF